MRGKVDLRLCS